MSIRKYPNKFIATSQLVYIEIQFIQNIIQFNNSFNLSKLNIYQIRSNTTVTDKENNWNILLFKEVYMIKKYRPSLKCGLKAAKELQLL